MYLKNGRMAQVGRDDGRPLGFRGLGAGGTLMTNACDPTTDDACLQALASGESIVTGVIDPSQYRVLQTDTTVAQAGQKSFLSSNSGLVLGLSIAFLGFILLTPPINR